MNAWMTGVSSRQMGLALAAAWCVCLISGCSDVDWNWDMAWRRRPARVVRPTPSRDTEAKATGDRQGQAGDDRRPQTTGDRQADRPTQATLAMDQPPVIADGPAAKQRPVAPRGRDASAASPSPRTGDRPVPQPSRPFHQLYVVSGPAAEAVDYRSEHVLRLTKAKARTCAALLEMLYVPVGRSGSDEECYLLYEEADEIQAALRIGPLLDQPAIEGAASAVGPQASLEAGIQLFHRILEQGAIVDRGLVDQCEHCLALASQANQLPPPLGWAASVLAGRLVSDYRYDFTTAETYARQAQRAAVSGSLEHMTALWWCADACIQQGKTAKASGRFEEILRTYGQKWPKAQVVRRSGAVLEHGRRK